MPEVRRGLIALLDDLVSAAPRLQHGAFRVEGAAHSASLRSHGGGAGVAFHDAAGVLLQEPDLAGAAMTLLFHLQGPELMQADRHPTSEVAYPIVVLSKSCRHAPAALPVEVSYTLPEMLARSAARSANSARLLPLPPGPRPARRGPARRLV